MFFAELPRIAPTFQATFAQKSLQNRQHVKKATCGRMKTFVQIDERKLFFWAHAKILRFLRLLGVNDPDLLPQG